LCSNDRIDWLIALRRQESTIDLAGQPPSPIAKAHPTSSGNHDDDPIGIGPSAIGSIDGDSQRVDVLDLLVLAMEPMRARC
jgi:hypothetical protein